MGVIRRNNFVDRPDRQCGSKLGFPSKQRAKLYLRRFRGRDSELVPYRCPHCRQFHIGHRPEGAAA